MMLYSTHTWDLVWTLESASPAFCKTPATSINSIHPNNHPRRKKRFGKKAKLLTNRIVLSCKRIILSSGEGGIFTSSKFKFKSFLNDLWFESETLWLFLTFTRDCFAEKHTEKILSYQEVMHFCTGGNVIKKEFTNVRKVL